MKTSRNYKLVEKDELMEIKGGFIISPSPLIPFIISFGDEICGSIKHACSSFVAGLYGQSEP